MNTQERWNYIKNNDEIISQYMAQHDEEVKTRKLTRFLNKGEPMSIVDIRILEAVTKLHEAARVVEQDIGHGTLSKDIRKCADRLSDTIKSKTPYEK